MKIVDSRKSKLTKKQLFMVLAGVAVLSLSTPVTSHAESNDEVLYEETEDNYETTPIDNNDRVEDNTVVQDGDKQEEEKKEEPKQEEEKKNDGGSCVTPDNGYDEKAGEYWDPSIKTEPEKKHLTPDTPPETPPETPPQTPPETPPQTPPTTPPETPNTPPVTPPPAQTPKTGDFTWREIAALLAGFGLVGGGIAYGVLNHMDNSEEKSKTR